MAALYERIISIYPDMKTSDFLPVGGFVLLRNDGDERGDYIERWEHPVYPRPTDEQLAAASDAAPRPIVPQTISDRQFFQQAAVAGIITQDEALAAVTIGAIPVALQAIVDGIQDANEKFGAKMLLSGATVFDRTHPLTEAVGAALGWSRQQVDDFFIQAAGL